MIGRYADLQLEFSSAVRTSAEQKELILKLEHDLSTIQTMSSLSRPDAEVSLGVAPQGELPQGQMDSLLSIISSQRERFRSRNQELEAESRSMQVTMQALQSELDSLRADNIKLYEKINDDTVTVRYSSQYEERLDPFASFSKRVLYKTAWSESIGRDCSALCAKKYSDHLHRFHENGDNL
ncbi:unnamed protein product [Coregonus sp. 'balchen']|nr:unnamed protein product [Coregonus sp. 'balchen']